MYAIGGDTSVGYTPVSPTNVNEEYDPTTNTWTYKSPMPEARYTFTTAVIGDDIYCIGGGVLSTGPGNYPWTGINQVYDTSTDIWTIKASVPNSNATNNFLVWSANTVNGIIYVTDVNSGQMFNYAYNPSTDNWSTRSPMPIGMGDYISAVANNKIYFFAFNKTQVYDPSTDSWSFAAPEPALPGETQPATDAWAAVATTGALAPVRIFVLGSDSVFGGEPCYNRIYDPQSDTWANGSDIPTYRVDFGAAVVNDQVYVVGGCTSDEFGFTNKEFSTNEQFTPAGYSGPGSTTPTPTIIQTPTATQTPTPATQTPNKSPNNQPMSTLSSIEIVAAVVIATVITASVLVERRRHNKSNRLLAK
jgi:hypothetical protein